MTQTKPELSTKQRRVIVAILGGMTFTDAASDARVGRSTVQRWLRDPEFTAALQAESGAAMAGARGRFGLLLDRALTVLDQAMHGQVVGECERWAVSLVMRHAAQLLELVDLEQRIARLEATNAKPKG